MQLVTELKYLLSAQTKMHYGICVNDLIIPYSNSIVKQNVQPIIADRVMRTRKQSGVRWILKVCKAEHACM